jgi:hypothetical protein
MDLFFIKMAMAIGLSANGAFIALMLLPVVVGGLGVVYLKVDALLEIQRFAAKKGVKLTLAECRRRKVIVERNYRPTFGELVIERVREQSRR